MFSLFWQAKAQSPALPRKDLEAGERQGLGFGRIKFRKDDEPKPYVRVPWSNDGGVSTPCDLLLHFVEHVWGLELPDLVVSITGAATDSLKNSDDLQQFLLDLMSFARRTSAWITTGGTHGGLMKLIGRISRTSNFQTPFFFF